MLSLWHEILVVWRQHLHPVFLSSAAFVVFCDNSLQLQEKYALRTRSKDHGSIKSSWWCLRDMKNSLLKTNFNSMISRSLLVSSCLLQLTSPIRKKSWLSQRHTSRDELGADSFPYRRFWLLWLRLHLSRRHNCGLVSLNSWSNWWYLTHVLVIFVGFISGSTGIQFV